METGSNIGEVMGRLVLTYGTIMALAIALIFYVRSRNKNKHLKRREEDVLAVSTAAAGGSIFDEISDEEVATLDMLMQAHQQETPKPKQTIASTPKPAPMLDEDDDIDLTSLLSSIVDEPVVLRPATGQHVISPEPIQVQLHTGAMIRSRELLSIQRDEADGRLVIQFGNLAYRSLVDVPEIKKEFSRLMKELSVGITQPDTGSTSSSVESVMSPSPSPVVPEVKAEPKIDLPLDIEAERMVANTLRAAQDLERGATVLPGDLPSLKMDDLGTAFTKGRFGQIKVKKVEKVEEVNFVEAIEAYLQYKISEAPPFQRRGIHVRPALHGVKIECDGKTFEGVGDVDDAEVRQFLQATIAEWQERQQNRR